MKLSMFVLAAGSLVALAGCSSSGNGGNSACSNTTPCGGNPIGSWNVTAECLKATSMVGFSCGPVSDHIAETFVTGTLTLNADSSYTSSFTVSLSESGTVPFACLTTAGTDCAVLAQVIEPANSWSSSCSNSNGGCSCRSTYQGTPSNDNGTYSLSGNYMTTVSTVLTTPGETTQYSFCVSANGGQLTLTPSLVAPWYTTFETGSLVFTKQ